MKKISTEEMNEVLGWCTSELGPVELMSDHSKAHGGHESATSRLHSSFGFCYIKVHETPSHWNNEVHAYERWAGSFGDFAPRLLAVRDEKPLALVVSELPGHILENAQLPSSQERAVWREAGAALVSLHALGPGDRFGQCLRDGTYSGGSTEDAVAYVSNRLKSEVDKAAYANYLNNNELATVRAAYDLLPAFEGERPTPCHRDYCPANWLVDEDGSWAGVIDFEFAYWDVRVADFSRYPYWDWINRPDLIDAFFEGYGRSLTSVEEQQLLVAHTEYALSAIVWGHEHSFFGFEQEGRESLAHLASLLR